MKYLEGSNDEYKKYGVDYFSLFRECSQQYELLESLFNTANEEDSEDNRDDMLDAIEEYMDESDTPHLFKYVKYAPYDDISIGRRLFDFKRHTDELKEIFDKVLKLYIYKRNERHDQIVNLLKLSLGHMSIFLYKEYGMDTTIETYLSDDETEVSMFLASALGVKSEAKIDVVIKYCEHIREGLASYYVNLPFFEQYSNLEIPFLEKAGEFINDVDEVSLYINEADVNTILKLDDPAEIKKLILQIKRRGETSGRVKESKFF